MFISIHDVPPYERHLLFCSDPALRREQLEQEDPAAINRALVIHGEVVDRRTMTQLPLSLDGSRSAVGVA
jgi:hypothetical protein